MTPDFETTKVQVEYVLGLAEHDPGANVQAIGHAVRAWHTPRVWPPAPPEVHGRPTFDYAEQLVELLKDPLLDEQQVTQLADMIVRRTLGRTGRL